MQPVLNSCIGEEDYELAGQYILELARDPANAYAIAMRLTFGDFGKANIMATAWRNDPEFQRLLREAQSNITAMDMLKTKEEFTQDVQDKMSGMSGKIWLETAKFFAELRGFIDKENNGPTFIQNVIQVPMDQGLDEWEKKAAASQRKLQNEARLINGHSVTEEKA